MNKPLVKITVHQNTHLSGDERLLSIRFETNATEGSTVVDQNGTHWFIVKRSWEPFYTGMVLRVKEVKK